MINRTYTLLIVMLIGLFGCEKNPNDIVSFLNDLQQTRYYSSEIFNDSFHDINGKWELMGISGGIHGGGHELNFDFLEIKTYGIYGFIRNDSIIEYGRIRIDDQTENTLLITLEPDENSEIFMYDSEKYVNLNGIDSLSLDSPCCDRFNYHFIREK